MKPILFITKLDLGGMERFCVTLCNEWTAQGRAFLLYVSYDGGETKNDVHAQDQVLVANRPARFATGALLRLCRAHPDSPLLVLSIEIGAVLLILKKFRLIKNRVIIRESTAVLSHNSWFWKKVYRFVVSTTDGFIVQSNQGRNDLEALLGKSLVHKSMKRIHSPCIFVTTQSPKAFIPRNGAIVGLLILGRLAPMKGHIRLLNALKSVEDVQWQLSIIGDGECRDAIQSEIERLELNGSVTMLGVQRDVRSYYERSDVFVIASDYEGLPNTLIEAIACGCRVLVVEGDGGTSDFMQTIGLGDFVFNRKLFDDDFTQCLKCVLNSDIGVWKRAYERLVELVQPKEVANQVWSFLE